MKFITLDVESGGVSTEFSLLTAYFEIFEMQNKEIVTLGSLEIATKPDDGIYRVNGEAMAVNGINLAEHDKTAITYKQAATEIYKWLNQWPKEKLTPMGQAISFDVSFIVAHTLSRNTWGQFCDRRVIDLISLTKHQQALGNIPEDQSLSLGEICKFYGIFVDESLRHTAKYDVELNKALFKKLSFG